MDVCRSVVEGVIDSGISEEGRAEEDVSVLVADTLNLTYYIVRGKKDDMINHVTA